MDRENNRLEDGRVLRIEGAIDENLFLGLSVAPRHVHLRKGLRRRRRVMPSF